MLVVAHRTPADADHCRRLADAGAGIFEVDVQLASSDQLAPSDIVVSHFQPVWPAWRAFQHDHWRFRVRTPRGGDPPLNAVLAAVPAHAQVLLDPKETDPHRRAALIAALSNTVEDPSRYLVSTFWPDDLAGYRAAGLGTWRTVETRAQLARALHEPLEETAVTIRHTMLTETLVGQLHARGVLVTTWTVNDVGRARQLREFGVDGVTTDSLAVMQELASG